MFDSLPDSQPRQVSRNPAMFTWRTIKMVSSHSELCLKRKDWVVITESIDSIVSLCFWFYIHIIKFIQGICLHLAKRNICILSSVNQFLWNLTCFVVTQKVTYTFISFRDIESVTGCMLLLSSQTEDSDVMWTISGDTFPFQSQLMEAHVSPSVCRNTSLYQFQSQLLEAHVSRFCWDMFQFQNQFLYPPQRSYGGYTGITLSVRPSVCLSVRL